MNEHEVSSLISRVEAAVSGALERIRSELSGADPVVHPSEHADFQSNAALALAKRPDQAGGAGRGPGSQCRT